MRFDLDVRGDRQAERRLAKLASNARELRPLLSDIADELLQGEREQWRTGSGWVPLAASTRARKRRQHLPSRAMRATGTLERALTRRGARGQRLTFGRDSVTFGLKGGRSDAFYGRFHQKGEGVPQRKVVVISQRTRRRVREQVVRHLTS